MCQTLAFTVLISLVTVLRFSHIIMKPVSEAHQKSHLRYKAVWTRKEFQPHYFQCWAMGIVANLSADAQRCTNGAKPTKLHIGKTLLRVGNESKGSFCKDQLNLILLLCRKGKQISRVYRLAHRTKKSIWSCH